MKKKLFVIILLGLFLLGVTGCGDKTEDSKEGSKNNNEKVLGVYHFDEKEETLTLKDDSKCIMRPHFPNQDLNKCIWSINDTKITVTYNYYTVRFPEFGHFEVNYYDDKAACVEDIGEVYADLGTEIETTLEGTLVDDGVLLDGHYFKKIG